MKKLLNLFLFAMLMLSFSCNPFQERIDGNGVMETETRTISRASKIKLLGEMDVYISHGEPSVKVEADGNLLPFIETELDDNWLEIKTRREYSLRSNNPIKVYVTTPSLHRISVAGSGDVFASGDMDNGNEVKLSIAGSGDITMELNTPGVDANIAGSGSLHLSGETRDLDVSIAGSGNFDGYNLKSEYAKVEIAGSGDVNVFADVNLKARIAGSGNVSYKGNATVDRKVMGRGSISKIP